MLLDALLVRLAHRHRAQRLLEALAPRLAASALIAATVVATLRLALPDGAWLVPALFAAGLLAPLPWLPTAWRRRDPPARLAGELDLLAGAHGLAMALAEQRDAAWVARGDQVLATVRIPPLRWAVLAPAAVAVALLAGAVLLPQAETPPPPAPPAANLVRPVREDLAHLAESGVIRPEERAELEKRLDQLLAQSQGGSLDQATWEGVDRLQSMLDAQAAAAGERLAAALATASAATASPPATDAQAAELAATLAQQLAALAAQAPGLVPRDLDDPQAREALAQALAQAQAQGLLSPAQVEALKQAGLQPGRPGTPNAAQGRALARALAKALGKGKNGLGQGRAATAAEAFLARLGKQGQGSVPGQGAPTRGPGTAEITQEHRDRTAGGEQAALAPGATLNPDGSVTIASQVRDAEPDEAARHDLERAAARAFDPAAADSRRAAVAPRHREVVEAYFRSDDGKK